MGEEDDDQPAKHRYTKTNKSDFYLPVFGELTVRGAA
jgi:hypothetical protein